MDNLDKKIIDNFRGKVVRKDLTALMKKGANVPTFVLEYLLGMYCATDDEKAISIGMKKISRVLSENYVHPDQSEYIKSKIREKGEYTIIDKISVRLCEDSDVYVASFTNLKIRDFVVSPDLVINNEKLLLGGIWCMIHIEYHHFNEEDDDEDEDLFENDKKLKKAKKKKKTRYSSPFSITQLKPIQMPNLNLNDIISCRCNFTKDEWIDLILRSAGYEPNELTFREKMLYLIRFVPLVQKNYNLVELGPRGTGKSHLYSEISPYSILLSSGHTTISNLFYHMGRRQVGLVGNWDCIAFDEVGGMGKCDMDTIQMLKNYMANGSFARGSSSINADASICYEGNTFRAIEDMLRTSTLFEPFPMSFRNDAAFFDRIHAYLPGWEIPKLRSSLLTDHFGLISDCLTEFCHGMRKYDFTNLFAEYFEFNDCFNTRDDIAVRKTFSGLAKLIYPDGKIEKEQMRELLEYAIEARRRVKEQLKKMSPVEYNDINLGYIDYETNTEYVIDVNEQPKSSLINDGYNIPGFVYAIGKSVNDVVAAYKLENKKINGQGDFLQKNIEGINVHNRNVITSIIAAFNYFKEHAKEVAETPVDKFDYNLYFDDLQSKGISDEVSVAEAVGLCSCLTNVPVMPSLVIVGRVVMSGSMMPIQASLEEIITCATNAGAKYILLPYECEEEFAILPRSLKKNLQGLFYDTPIEACKIALQL